MIPEPGAHDDPASAGQGSGDSQRASLNTKYDVVRPSDTSLHGLGRVLIGELKGLKSASSLDRRQWLKELLKRAHEHHGCLELWHGEQLAGRIVLGTNRVRIGRDQCCELTSDAQGVSRVHAFVEKESSQDRDWVLEDFESSNGVFWCDRRIRRIALRHGDVVQLGSPLRGAPRLEYYHPRSAWEQVVHGVGLASLVGSALVVSGLMLFSTVGGGSRVEFIGGPVKIVSADGNRVDEQEGAATALPRLEDYPLHLRQALLASEDGRFGWNSGLDIGGTLRSLVKSSGGGSGITQQVARMYYPWVKRGNPGSPWPWVRISEPDLKYRFPTKIETFARKIRELPVAWQLETHFNKNRILKMYLDRAVLGMGTEGFEQAAQLYFRKSARILNLPESAYLVGLLPLPGGYNVCNAPTPEEVRSERQALTRLMVRLQRTAQARSAPLSKMDFQSSLGDERRPSNEEILNALQKLEQQKYGTLKQTKIQNGKSWTYIANRTLKSDLEISISPQPDETTWTPKLRRNLVLGRMLAERFISEDQYRDAIRHPLKVDLSICQHSTYKSYPFFSNYAMEELAGPSYSLNLSQQQEGGNYYAVATVKPSLQSLGEATVKRFLETDGEPIGVNQAALISLNFQTGEILAYVGGKKFGYKSERGESSFDRVRANRQPGSTFKLFSYLAALEDGFRPEDQISCLPIYQLEGGCHQGGTSMSMSQGLALSENPIALHLADKVGFDLVIRMARKLGITTNLEANPSMVLGGNEALLYEMAQAYAVVANGGRAVTLKGVNRIYDLTICGSEQTLSQCPAHAIFTPMPQKNQELLAPSVANAMDAMLLRAVREGTGRNASVVIDARGKTGTTNNGRDAWFIGYSPIKKVLTGIWMGNDDNRPSKDAAGSLAAKLWGQYMSKI